MKFSEILKNLRYEKGYTQIELAKKAKLSPACIAMIETDKNEPSASTILSLANALEISADKLLGRDNDYEITKHSNYQLTNIETELFNIFRSLNEHDKYKVLGFAQALAY